MWRLYRVQVSERYRSVGMYMDVNCGGLKLRVQSLAPTEQGTPHAKHKFYKMAKTLNMLPSNDPHRNILQMADFNASTSAALTRTCFKGDSFGEYENNENGDLLPQNCVEEKLQIIQTFFEHKWSHRVTWKSNDKVTEKVIDYALSAEWIRRHTIDARTRPGYAIDSDHVMLVLRMRAPRFRLDRKEHCPNHPQNYQS